MRPNTMASGILSTKRNRPVSTSMLTRMLVPKPKKAFQSPGVHSFGSNGFALLMDPPDQALRCVSPLLARVSAASAFLRIRNPAEDAALRLDHFQAHVVEFRKIGCAAVGEHDAAVAAVVCLAHGGVDADFGGDAGDHQVLDGAIAQHRFEIGLVEGAFARLVDDRLARDRVKLRHDVVAGLAADQDAAHRSFIADALARSATLHLCRRSIRKIGTVTLACMDHQQAGVARGGEHRLQRLHRRLQPRHVVAERFAKSARLQEVALHVDDEQRRAVERDAERLRFGRDQNLHHAPRLRREIVCSARTRKPYATPTAAQAAAAYAYFVISNNTLDGWPNREEESNGIGLSA